jgi:hypothetical protein
MKVIKVKKKQTAVLGKQYTHSPTWLYIDKSAKVVNAETGHVLAVFVKGALNPGLVQAGRTMDVYNATTDKRTNVSVVDYVGVCHGKRITRSKRVPSSIVGFSAANSFHPCRATKLYREHIDLFSQKQRAVVARISSLFRHHCPDQYKKQEQFIQSINQNMRIPDTVFTTLTINKSLRTNTHVDRADFKSGLGNLTVFKTGTYSGCELLLPAYKIAFDVQEGDVLFFDVNEPHCNSALKGGGRIALVCYAQQQILKRCSGKDVTKHSLWHPVSHMHAHKNGTV